MAKWVPADAVEANEPIGRRLFDEPMLIGTAGQPSYSGLLVTHFEETRGDDLSVDRMGRTGIDKKVVSFLSQRAEAAGKTFTKPKTFNGWIVITAREIRKDRKRKGLALVASPVTEPASDVNPYHAHISRPADLDSTLMALYLRWLFTTYGKVEVLPQQQQDVSWSSWFLNSAPWRWIVLKVSGR